MMMVLEAYFKLRKPCQVEIGYTGNAKMNGVYFLIQSISIERFENWSMTLNVTVVSSGYSSNRPEHTKLAFKQAAFSYLFESLPCSTLSTWFSVSSSSDCSDSCSSCSFTMLFCCSSGMVGKVKQRKKSRVLRRRFD